MKVWEIGVLVRTMNKANAPDDEVDFDEDPDGVNDVWREARGW